MDVVIRPEQHADVPAIRALNLLAFPEAAEANLVDELRAHGKAMLSLVAVQNDRIVGHILFSPVTVDSNEGPIRVLGLAPMAVLPDVQRQGIGSLLVATGLAQCRDAGVGCVIVLGHATYYPRFGFKTARRFGISCEYDVPDEYFMVVELAEGSLNGISGMARYQSEFANV
jgi:putative acetyltransferase